MIAWADKPKGAVHYAYPATDRLRRIAAFCSFRAHLLLLGTLGHPVPYPADCNPCAHGPRCDLGRNESSSGSQLRGFHPQCLDAGKRLTFEPFKEGAAGG